MHVARVLQVLAAPERDTEVEWHIKDVPAAVRSSAAPRQTEVDREEESYEEMSTRLYRNSSGAAPDCRLGLHRRTRETAATEGLDYADPRTWLAVAEDFNQRVWNEVKAAQ